LRLFRNKFDIVLAILGAVALFCLSPIGAMLALIAAIAVIGLPLTFIMGAIPTIFLFLLIARLVYAALPLRGAPGVAIGGAVSLAVLAVVPWLANRDLAATADALVAGDMTLPAPQRFSTLALVQSGRGARPSCGDLCQRALLNGAADRVIVARAETATDTLPDSLSGTAYRIEPRSTCPDLDLKDGIEPLELAGEKRQYGDPTAADMLRMRAARGQCLVEAPATIAEADAVLQWGSVRKGTSPVNAGMSPFADTVSASRLSLYIRENDSLAERHRTTAVTYNPLLPILAPSYVGGYGFELRAGLLRGVAFRGDAERYRQEPRLGAFLQQTLKMDLLLHDEDADADTRQLIVDIIEGPTAPDRTAGKVINRLFEKMRARPKSATREDAELALRVLADRRVPIPRDVAAASRAFRDDADIAPRLADALYARLGDTPPQQKEDDPDYLGYTLSYLANAIDALPDDTALPYRAVLETLARNRQSRVTGYTALRKLSAFGADAVPTLIYLIDDAHAVHGKIAAGEDDWQHPYLAGLQGLCRMGAPGASAVPLLYARLAAGKIALFGSYWDLTAVTLASLGATTDDIWPHLQTDDRNATRERLERVAARALEKRDCSY